MYKIYPLNDFTISDHASTRPVRNVCMTLWESYGWRLAVQWPVLGQNRKQTNLQSFCHAARSSPQWHKWPINDHQPPATCELTPTSDLWFDDAWLRVEAAWIQCDSVPLIRQFITERTSLSSPIPDHHPTYCDCTLQQIFIITSNSSLMHAVPCILKVLTTCRHFVKKIKIHKFE